MLQQQHVQSAMETQVGKVINSSWEESGKVTEKSLHLEGD